MNEGGDADATTDAPRPADAEEVREAVAEALAAGRTLAVHGRASKVGLGRPVDAAATLRLDRLSGVGLYEPEELVMSAGAGTPIAAIEEELARAGQQLEFEPPDYAKLLGGTPGAGSIGGVFACNLGGPRRIKNGAARDHLLGLRAVTGRGEAIKTGGRVVKNVTGYDLCKLFAGSFGTLGVMTEVTFKVLPAAEDERTVALTGLDLAATLEALRDALASPFDVSAAAALPAEAAARSACGTVAGAGDVVGIVRLEGPEPSVRYRADRLSERLARFNGALAEIGGDESKLLWREVRDVTLLPTDRLLWRVSVAPTEGAAYLERLRGRPDADGLDAEGLLDWGGGLVWLTVANEADDAGADAVRAALNGRGHATLVRAPEDVRRRVPVFHPQPPALAALAERVRRGFDPKDILNPGRMNAPQERRADPREA